MQNIKSLIIAFCIGLIIGTLCAGIGIYYYTKNGLDKLKSLNLQSTIDLDYAKKSITKLENTNRDIRQSYTDIQNTNQQLTDGYNKIQDLIRKIDNQQ